MNWFTRSINAVRKWFDPQWRTLSGSPISGGSGYYDVFNSKPTPSAHDLIRAYEETVYACSTIIATNLGATELKLMSGPAIGRKQNKQSKEITAHPLLDLLYYPNPFMCYAELVGLISLYLEIVGSAYVLKKRDNLGVPAQLWILPAQNVQVHKDKSGFICGYSSAHDQETPYPCEDIIHFKALGNLECPYSEGTSPLQAVWQRVQLGRKELSYTESLVSNMARPDAILSPDGEQISNQEIDRLVKDFTHRFKESGAGGIFVANSPLKLQPLNFAPKDMAEMALFQQVRDTVCNAYRVPITVLQMQDSNRASAEAGNYFLALHCLTPRLHTLVETLNRQLVRDFGSGLYLEPEEIVPEDKEYELRKRQAMVTVGALLINEWRDLEGLPPVPWGDQPPAPAPAPMQMSAPVPHEKASPRAPKAPPSDLLADALRRVFRQQKAQVLLSLKDLDLTSIQTKSVLTTEEYGQERYQWKNTPTGPFIDLSAWNAALFEEVFPVIELYAKFGTAETLTRIGATPKIAAVVQPGVREQAEKLTLQFCQETNETTSLILTDALSKLREEIATGVEQGEVRGEITKRVQSVFENADLVRADKIAATESTRAVHNASLTTARNSGLVSGKKWLPASNACEICLGFEAKGVVPLDQPFGRIGTGTYSRIDTAPAHPHCRCSITYELADD